METNDIWKDQLIAGNLFIKHHKYTDPKLRHIWLSNDLDRISWGEPVDTSVDGWEKNRKEKGLIQVKVHNNLNLTFLNFGLTFSLEDIVSIIPGLHNAKTMDKKNTDLRMPCIFSIITNKRTLELEAPTEKLRNDWIEYLKQLITHSRARKSMH